MSNFVVFIKDSYSGNYFTIGKSYEVFSSLLQYGNGDRFVVEHVLDDFGMTFRYPTKEKGFIPLSEYRDQKIETILTK